MLPAWVNASATAGVLLGAGGVTQLRAQNTYSARGNRTPLGHRERAHGSTCVAPRGEAVYRTTARQGLPQSVKPVAFLNTSQ